MSTHFKHKTPIQIRFVDLDRLGHVNNANHLSYVELARINYSRDVLGTEIDWSVKGIILAKSVVDYKEPILLEDKIFVYTKCSRMGSKSFDLSYSIVKIENNKEVEVANALTIVVCYNYELKETFEIPEDWRKKIENFEK